MREIPDYEELCRLEPRVKDVEAQARAVNDDGQASFFCSNFAWLPVQAQLKMLVGVHRKLPLEEGAEVLLDSRTFEVAYDVLSPLLPPCRACGCVMFEPIRQAQQATWNRD
jgi:hypothetical protein